jgi:hypothetical protein
VCFMATRPLKEPESDAPHKEKTALCVSAFERHFQGAL